MRCPYCGTDDDRVLDSRATEDGAAVRRRRACNGCGQRFSTYERAEQAPLVVRKRSGETEPFERAKIARGIASASRTLDEATVRRTAARVEASVRASGRRIVDREVIGAAVLEALRDVDPVGYIRFASVYKGFTSAEEFAEELARAGLEKDTPPKRHDS